MAAGCWTYALFARQAPVAVILRRGPSAWWRLTRWDTKNDVFEPGQWFRGSVYPAKCDLSPNGNLFSYFAGKFRPGDVAQSWVAISRPPYFTALSLWPEDSTWGGHTAFLNNGAFFAVTGIKDGDCPLKLATIQWTPAWERNGWQKQQEHTYRKTSGDRELHWAPDAEHPNRWPGLYSLRAGGREEIFEAHWADFDQQGRLVAGLGGQIRAGQPALRRGIQWRELRNVTHEKPETILAPDWARHW